MEHVRDCFASSWQLLKRNPELRKVLLAYGLQQATASLPDTFVDNDIAAVAAATDGDDDAFIGQVL